jgi:hypothetical protein
MNIICNVLISAFIHITDSSYKSTCCLFSHFYRLDQFVMRVTIKTHDLQGREEIGQLEKTHLNGQRIDIGDSYCTFKNEIC